MTNDKKEIQKRIDKITVTIAAEKNNNQKKDPKQKRTKKERIIQ